MKFKLYEDYISEHENNDGTVIIIPSNINEKQVEELNDFSEEYTLLKDLYYCDDDTWWNEPEDAELFGLAHRTNEYYIKAGSIIRFTGIGLSGWLEVNVNNADENLDIASDPFGVKPVWNDNAPDIDIDGDIQSLEEKLIIESTLSGLVSGLKMQYPDLVFSHTINKGLGNIHINYIPDELVDRVRRLVQHLIKKNNGFITYITPLNGLRKKNNYLTVNFIDQNDYEINAETIEEE